MTRWTSWLRNLVRKTNVSASRKATRRLGKPTSLRPSVELLEDRLTPATFHWVGTTATNGSMWGAANNWKEKAIPVSGSTLVFDTTTAGFSATANGFAPNNNLTGLTNLTIVINDASPTADFALTGNSFGLRNTAGVAVTSTVTAGTAAVINNPIDLTANTTVAVGLGTLTLGGVLSDGASSFSLTNAGTVGSVLALNAANAYDGGTTLTRGTVQVGHNNALGTGLLTFAGGTLANGPSFLKVPNAFKVTATSAIGGGGFFELAGNGSLSTSTVLNLGNSGFFTLSGVLSGAGSLNEAAGTTTFTGTAANTFSGAVTVTSGGITLAKPPGLKAVSGTVKVSDSLNLNTDDQLNGVNVTLIKGQLNLNGRKTKVGSINGSGSINTGTGLTVTNAGTQLFTGTVQGTGSLTYAGTGSLTLAGASPDYTGTLTAQAGTLAVTANFSKAPAQLAGGTLTGTGIVKTLTATAGTINPGAVGAVGLLTLAPGTFASDLAGATFTADLGAGGTADQLVIGDGATAKLTGATLNVNVLSTSTGREYTIVSSASGGLIGTFAGLANNATLVSGGRTFRINYTAKAVTLTDLAGTANTLHWVGTTAANGNLWNVAANWKEKAIPVSGSTLIFDTTTVNFSASANGFAPNNNIAGLTNLNIVVNDASSVSDFAITGNEFGLRNTAGVGIASTVTTGTAAVINNPITLAANTTVALGFGTLTLGGIVSDGASSFSLNNASAASSILILSAANSYNGGTTLTRGTVQVGHNNALGTGLITFAGGTLANGAAFLKVPNAFKVTATSTIGGGSFFDLTGNGVLNSGTVLNLANSGFLTLSGAISGAGGLNEIGFPGSTTLAGTAANTYTGATTVTFGGLTLAKPPGVRAVSTSLKATGTFSSINLNTDDQLNGVNVTLVGGQLNLNGHKTKVASINGTGTVQTGIGLTVTGGGTQLFTGIVQGTGSLTYAGVGSLTLAGASPDYTGTLVAQAGTLAVSANFAKAPAQLTGGTLTGTGIVNTLTATAGTINPGGVGGVGFLTAAPGIFASNLAGATFTADLSADGTADKLVIGNGATAKLTGATLNVNVLGSVTGSVYTIVSSTTSGIIGTFTGLANNATLVSGGRTFRINYTAKAVTLTDIT